MSFFMTQMRISQAARLMGVSDDTLRRRVETGRLPATTDDAGRKVIDGRDLALFAEEMYGEPPAAPGESRTPYRSARNHLTGLVTRVTSDTVMSQVELHCGPFRIVSLISTEAVRDLGLQPGSVATAVVKATSVSIDTSGAEA